MNFSDVSQALNQASAFEFHRRWGAYSWLYRVADSTAITQNAPGFDFTLVERK